MKRSNRVFKTVTAMLMSLCMVVPNNVITFADDQETSESADEVLETEAAEEIAEPEAEEPVQEEVIPEEPEPVEETVTEEIPAETEEEIPETEEVITEEEPEAEEAPVTEEPEEVIPEEENEEVTPAPEETAEKELEIPEEEKPAETEEPEVFSAGELKYPGNDFTVTLSYDAEAKIPAGAGLEVREIAKGTAEYNSYLSGAENVVDNGVAQARFFDIKIVSEGTEVTPEVPVRVVINYRKAINVASEGEVQAVHFEDGTVTPEKLNTDTNGGSRVSEIAFDAESFSVYGVLYTVDFTYDGYTFSLKGLDSIYLSELASQLNLYEKDYNKAFSVDNVSDVVFTDYSLLSFEKQGSDWLITSLSSFTSKETLTITMNDGVTFVIDVTDPPSATSTNLADFLDDVTITAPMQDGVYVVEPGESYKISLRVSEKGSSSLQFDNEGPLTYQLPEGIGADGHQGTLTIKLKKGTETFDISGNTFSISGNTLTFNWNKDDPNFEKLRASADAAFTVSFEGTFDENIIHYHFKDGIEKDIVVDTSNSVSVAKTASVDKENNKLYYTVSVSSDGNSKNVKLTDTLTGEGLTLDRSSFSATSSTGGAVSGELSGSGNSFEYKLGDMKNGEIITVKYAADIDPSVLSKIQGKTIAVAENSVKVNSDGDPEGDTSKTKNEIDYTPSVNKSGAEITGVTEDGKKILKWTTTYNNEAQVSGAGDSITDSIKQSSRNIMTMHGDGITVTVLDRNGNTVRPAENIPWSQLTASDDYSWTYTVPAGDTEPYRYTIEYYTEVDVSELADITVVDNDVTTSNDKESHGQGTVGPDGEIVKLGKSVKDINVKDREVVWDVTFNVPAEGLDKAVVTDFYPKSDWGYVDVFKAFSDTEQIQVTGLADGETFTVEPGETSAVITFKKSNGEDGLDETDASRIITVTLKTTLDEAWLEKSTESGLEWLQSHTNSAELDIGTKVEKASATAIVTAPKMLKTAEQAGTRTVNGVELPVYKYTISLYGITEPENTIIDKFDTSLLEVYKDPSDAFYTKSGNEYTVWQLSDGPATFINTPDGIEINTNTECLRANPESTTGFYSRYDLYYYLTVKDAAALQKIMGYAAETEDGKYTMDNTAEWNGKTGTGKVTYQYDGLDKELLTEEDELIVNDDDIWLTFRITLNPGALMLNNGEPLTMTDTVENLSVDLTTVTATQGSIISVDMSGYTVTYTIPDATKVVIRYRAKVEFKDIGSEGESKTIKFKNVAEMEGYRDEISNTATRNNTGEGTANLAIINILKYAAGNVQSRLAGAEFELLDADKNPILDKNGNPVTVETGDDGIATVEGNQEDLGWALDLETTYFLHEIKAPEGYKLDETYYQFSISRYGETDYANRIYYSGDNMSVKNYPGTDIKVLKSWKNSAGEEVTPPEGSTVEVKLQQKIGDGEFSDVIREEVKQDGGVWAWVDTPGKTLTLSSENDWEDWFKALPLVVPTGDDFDGEDVSVEYKIVETKVNGEEPDPDKVTIEESADGGATVFSIANIIEEQTGSLKLKKNVTFNGEPTTGTQADGTYTFTVKGPGTGEDAVTKTVVIKVENGKAVSATVDGTEVTLDSDGYVEVADLKAGEYTIHEEDTDNDTTLVGDNDRKVTVEAGKTGTEVPDAAKEVFTNNIDKGALKVKKNVTVNGSATTGTQADGTYTFTVKGPGEGDDAVTKTVVIKVENGTAVSATVDGTAVTLDDQGFVKIEDLTPGDYTVTEDTSKNPDGMAIVGEATKTVTVAGGSTAEVKTAVFTNNIDKGALKVKKNVTVNGETTTGTEADGTYTFTVKGPGEGDDAVTKTVVIKVENGTAVSATVDGTAVTLDDQGFVKIEDLTPGDYTVTEDTSKNPDGMAIVGEATKTVTVAGGSTAEVKTAVFTNNIDKGALKVKKNVTVNGETTTGTEADGTYTFTVKGPGEGDDAVTKTVVIKVENGTAVSATVDGTAVTLDDQGFVKIEDLTPGDYTVTEDTSKNPDGMAIVGEATKTVTVAGGSTAEVKTAVFTNNKVVVGGLKVTKIAEVNYTQITDGRTISDGTYEFLLLDAHGNRVRNAKLADGTAISNGEFSIEIINGEAKTVQITDLVPGDYYVYEKAPTNGTYLRTTDPRTSYVAVLDDYAVKLTVTAGETAEIPEAKFYNNRRVGSLRLSKAITVNKLNIENPNVTDKTIADGDYTFTIKGPVSTDQARIPESEQKTYTVVLTVENGRTAGATLDGKELTLYKRNYDYYAEIPDLEPGHYIVTEMNPNNGTTVLNPDGLIGGETDSSKIGYVRDYAGRRMMVTVIEGSEGESFIYRENAGKFDNNINTGNLKIRKYVRGTSKKDKDFTFEITLTPPANVTLKDSYAAKLNGTDTTASITGGKVTVTLKAEDVYEIIGLPEDTQYTVTETNLPDGYSEGTHSGASGTIHPLQYAGHTISEPFINEVTMANKYSAEGKAVLEIEKAVDGADWPEGGSITFTLTGKNAPMPAAGGDTVTLTAAGKGSFGEIKYTEADLSGSPYEYTITETSGFGAGWTNSGVVKATVELTDNGNGTIATQVKYTPGNDKITNTYDADGSVELEAEKKLAANSEWPTGKTVTFTLTGEGDAPMPEAGGETVTLSEPGTAKFGEIKYGMKDDGKTYTYKVSETSGFGTPWKNSGDITATVEVNNAGGGKLETTVKYSPDSKTITNKYEATGSITFAGTKTLEGRDLEAGEFTFDVLDENGETVVSATSDATGKINYPEIKYFLNETTNDVGDHTYTVKETTKDGKGIKVDINTYTVTVNVADAGNGTLTVTPSDNYQALNFVNTYEATGSITFKGTKTLEGRKMESTDIFTFTVTEGDDVIATVRNAANGDINYPTINYVRNKDRNDVGTHTYTIKETTEDGNGITVDETEYEVTVVVADNNDGTLSVTCNDEYEALDFVNTYEAKGSVTFEGTKTLEGRDLKEGDVFTFEIINEDGETVATADSDSTGKITYPTIEYVKNSEKDETGTHTYTVKEAATDIQGITIDTTEYTVTVEVTDKKDGTLEVTPSDNYQSLDFVNTYGAKGEITFAGTKSIDSRDLTGDDVFTFTVTEGDTLIAEVKNDADGKIAYPTIEYVKNSTQDDTGDHTYTVKETSKSGKGITVDTNTYTVTVNVADAGDGTLTVTPSDNYQALDFVNTYKATGNVTFAGTKTIDSRDLTEDDVFTFTVTEGDTLIAEVTNDEAGNIAYPTINYVLDDKTDNTGEHTYTVKETSTDGDGITVDTNEYTVTVKVTDNKDGTLKIEPSNNYTALNFVNTYKATGEITFEGTKSIDCRDLTEDEVFTFTVIEDGEEIASATNDETGKINYPTISYELSAEQDDTGEHIYTVKETSKNGNGITIDKTEYEVTVKVTDNEDGTLKIEPSKNYTALDFENTYEATGEITFTGTKSIDSRDLTEDDIFTFTIMEGEEVVAETENDTDGEIMYPTLSFILRKDIDDTGVHTYTVKETAENGKGITVDTNEYTVKVTVEDNKDGTLTVTSEDDYTALDFENKYDAEGSTVLEAKKVLVGERPLEEGLFTFELIDENGEVVDTQPNAADGSVTFKTLEYTLDDIKDEDGKAREPKDFVYTIREVIPEGAEEVEEGIYQLNGMQYDTTEHTATVTVSDNKDGTLEVTVEYENGEAPIFTNTYMPEGETPFSVAKALDGREWKDDDKFEFTIAAVTEGAPLPEETTAYATKDAKVAQFGNAKYTEAGVYEYTITETKGDIPFITYDTEPKKVTVTVTDETYNGELTTVVTYEGKSSLTVTNTYGELKFNKYTDEGKTLSGAELTLYEAGSDKAIVTWTTDGKEKDLIDYLEAGKSYVIKETKVPENYMPAEDVKFSVDAEGKITGITLQQDNNGVYHIIDAQFRVEVKKTDEQGRMIEGAVLAVKDSNGKIVDQWETNGGVHVVKGLTAGETYTLTELTAPRGYSKAPDQTFKAGKNGEANVTTLIMVDKKLKSPDTSDHSGTAGWGISMGASLLMALWALLMRRRAA